MPEAEEIGKRAPKLAATPLGLGIDTAGVADAGIRAELLPAGGDLSAGLSAIATEGANGPVVRRFVRFAVALAVIPFAVYWAALRALGPAAAAALPRGVSPPIVAGAAAVLTVNLIAAAFALLAVLEQPSAPARSKTE